MFRIQTGKWGLVQIIRLRKFVPKNHGYCTEVIDQYLLKFWTAAYQLDNSANNNDDDNNVEDYHKFLTHICFCKWLISFSVPYGLSMGGSKEEWAEAFLARLQEKWESCKNAWKSLRLEVSELKPQAIVL